MTYNINILPHVAGIYRFKVVLLGIDNDLKDKFYEINSTLADDTIKTNTKFYPKNLTLFFNNKVNKINFIIFNPTVYENYFYGHILVGAKSGIIFYNSKDPYNKIKELILEFLKFTRNNTSIPVIFTIDTNIKPNPYFEIPSKDFCSHVKIIDFKSIDFNNFETSGDSDRLLEILASNLIINNAFEKEVDITDVNFLNKVRNLSLKGYMLEDDYPVDLEFLKECNKLESLDLSGVKIDPTQLDILTGFTLNKLLLRGTRFVKNKEFTLDFLSGNKKLETLDLSGLLMNKIDLTPLSTCTNLTELVLCSNELSEIELRPLMHLEKLDTIDLCFNNFDACEISIPEKIGKIKDFKINDLHDFLNTVNLKTHCFCRWCN